MFRFLMISVTAILLAVPCQAAEIAIGEALVLEIDAGDGWVLCLEPPEPLVAELASHVAHEPAAAGATEEQIAGVARRRLAANEAILYHPASGAHLDIDFSPLAPGEPAPDARALRQSAQAAAQSLEHEADVSQLVWNIVPTRMTGVAATVLLSAGYLQDDRPMIFLGYVGYVAKSWFFLYFTAPGDAPEVLQQVQSMLTRAAVRPAAS